MVSGVAPAGGAAAWPCDRLEGSRGSVPSVRAGRRGRRLLGGLLAWAGTVPGGPGDGGVSGTGWLHRQRVPSARRRGAPGDSRRHSSALTRVGFGARPAPEEAPSRMLGAPFRGDSLRPRGCAGGRTSGPDGGAGAGRVPAPREMPSGARCRLYLRSRLTSAARVPRARAAPGDLARPLHPHSLIPLR